GRGRPPAAGRLHDHLLGPRDPRIGLERDLVVTAHEPDRHAPRPERQSGDPGLADRPPLEGRERGLAAVGVRDRARWVAGASVVAHEKGNLKALLGTGASDHRPWLLALEQHGAGIEVLRGEVEHQAVAVVDEHLGGAAGERALDRGVRLTDYQCYRGRVAGIATVGRQAVADPTDALHVAADVDLHLAYDARPL